MNKEDYDKYYQQGGSYVIPVEIFNELFEDYECFKNDCKKYKEVINKNIELLNQPWSFESGNKQVNEITKNKKWEIINLLKEVE